MVPALDIDNSESQIVNTAPDNYEGVEYQNNLLEYQNLVNQYKEQGYLTEAEKHQMKMMTHNPNIKNIALQNKMRDITRANYGDPRIVINNQKTAEQMALDEMNGIIPATTQKNLSRLRTKIESDPTTILNVNLKQIDPTLKATIKGQQLTITGKGNFRFNYTMQTTGLLSHKIGNKVNIIDGGISVCTISKSGSSIRVLNNSYQPPKESSRFGYIQSDTITQPQRTITNNGNRKQTSSKPKRWEQQNQQNQQDYRMPRY